MATARKAATRTKPNDEFTLKPTKDTKGQKRFGSIKVTSMSPDEALAFVQRSVQQAKEKGAQTIRGTLVCFKSEA